MHFHVILECAIEHCMTTTKVLHAQLLMKIPSDECTSTQCIVVYVWINASTMLLNSSVNIHVNMQFVFCRLVLSSPVPFTSHIADVS